MAATASSWLNGNRQRHSPLAISNFFESRERHTCPAGQVILPANRGCASDFDVLPADGRRYEIDFTSAANKSDHSGLGFGAHVGGATLLKQLKKENKKPYGCDADN